ncbi:hypothetical protein PMAYCL1PPCAC_23825 [Pristionchus mayeri]|uniref:Uncharacterized protein n=1 Tax=Pristionchus mayeri TaxID=1317129 RepID=A0AAN5D076_9BILA|nr:hypothetical protein PMAYCL1PPCAC_23825 [Pristionchus mayeri]
MIDLIRRIAADNNVSVANASGHVLEYLDTTYDNRLIRHDIESECNIYSAAVLTEEKQLMGMIDRIGQKILTQHNTTVLANRDRETRQKMRSLVASQAVKTSQQKQGNRECIERQIVAPRVVSTDWLEELSTRFSIVAPKLQTS